MKWSPEPGRPDNEEVQLNRVTAATLIVVVLLSGTGPLLAQGAERNASPSLERILKLLQQPEGSVLAPVGIPAELTAATHPDLARLQAGVLQQQTAPPRRGGNATMIVFYSLFFGGIALTIDGIADDPNSKGKVFGGLAMIGGAFALSCATGVC